MKSCRLPVAILCLLAGPLNQVHPDAIKIRVGIKPLEPFGFFDEGGQPSGFSIDL